MSQAAKPDLEEDKDINDVFSDILLAEDKVFEESYKEGYTKGASEGNIEGYHLGYHRGAELGAELGYYLSIVEGYLNEANEKQYSDKIKNNLTTIIKLINKFPRENVNDVDIFAEADKIRSLFKKKMVSVNIIQEYMKDLIDVIKQYAPLMNAHMVDYFTKNIYDNYMPNEIKSEIEDIGCDSIINFILNKKVNRELPNLYNLIEITKKFTLCNRKDVCLSAEDLQRRLNVAGCMNTPSLHLNVFMKPKKSHEVEILSAIAASLKTIDDISHIVDIGDGKGYLSSLLSLYYKIPVLGIDAAEVNTTGAVKRAEKLGKSWHGIIGTNKSILPKSELRYDNAYNLLYKQTTQYITENTNLKELVKNIFVENISYLGIVGLHTCGDLAPSALKIYVNNSDVRTICNVSCCYHLLTEKAPNDKDPGNFGFPMSSFLKVKEFYLGRNARMLSAHSADRILDRKELPNKNIFYRAVFEVFLNQHFPDINTREVGRFKMSNVEFNVYAKRALKKLKLNSNFSDEELHNFYRSFESKQNQLYAFSLLRSMLAPLIESLILLDRLLYLNEYGFGNSYLVQLFDPVVSPRCYGIISFKKM